jgi:gas vesicle protein
MPGTNKKGGVNPIVAAVTGAVVGGIAVAGAMTMADEKKREQVKDALGNVKDKVMDTKESIENKIADAREMAMDKVDNARDALKHAAGDIKDAVE